MERWLYQIAEPWTGKGKVASWKLLKHRSKVRGKSVYENGSLVGFQATGRIVGSVIKLLAVSLLLHETPLL